MWFFLERQSSGQNFHLRWQRTAFIKRFLDVFNIHKTHFFHRFWCLGEVVMLSMPKVPVELHQFDYNLLEFFDMLGVENAVKLLVIGGEFVDYFYLSWLRSPDPELGHEPLLLDSLVQIKLWKSLKLNFLENSFNKDKSVGL